jgi:hypothetical protein
LALEAEQPAARQDTPPATPAQPFHVGKGADIPAVDFSLVTNPKIVLPAKTAAIAPSVPPAAKPATPAIAAAKDEPAPKLAPPQPKLVPGAKRNPSLPLPELDSTQTIRALTVDELTDDAQEKWFSIQLAASEQPVNLDAMPHLDIFEAYRLYSVAGVSGGKIIHSLRLGFFREEVSAEAVSGYLKTFFPNPSVVRISIAEQARFKDAPGQKAAALKPEATIHDLGQTRERNARSVVPTVTEVAGDSKADVSATGKFKMRDASATGKFKAADASATGKFKVSNTGKHKALASSAKPAAKAAGPATKRSEPVAKNKTSSTGKYQAPRKQSLEEQLIDEAREVELSESGIRKLPKNHSLLSRLVGKLTK